MNRMKNTLRIEYEVLLNAISNLRITAKTEKEVTVWCWAGSTVVSPTPMHVIATVISTANIDATAIMRNVVISPSESPPGTYDKPAKEPKI
jgi:hypothetical protein